MPVAEAKHPAATVQQSVLLRWRRPGVDFDLKDSVPSTLDELIALGGLFPLAKVQDRLPFKGSTLQRWAKEGEESPFGKCFVRVPGQEKALVVLVDIAKLDAATTTATSAKQPRKS